MIKFLIQFFFLIVSSTAFAAAETATPGLALPAAPSIWSLLISSLVIIVFILLIAYIINRIGFTSRTMTSHIKIISSYSIGIKEKLVLVEVADQQLLIGITANQITPLLSVDAENKVNSISSEQSFARRLQSCLVKEVE